MGILWIDKENRKRLAELLGKTNSIEHLKTLLDAVYFLHEGMNLVIAKEMITKFQKKGKLYVIKELQNKLSIGIMMAKNIVDILWDKV